MSRCHAPLPPLPETLRFTAARRAYGAPELFAGDSDEYLAYMCPVLGPTATMLSYRLTRWMRELGDGIDVEREMLAAQFGINLIQLTKSLNRLVQFDAAQQPDPDTWTVFTGVSHYPVRWAERLPVNLRDQLIEWQRLVVAAR